MRFLFSFFFITTFFHLFSEHASAADLNSSSDASAILAHQQKLPHVSLTIGTKLLDVRVASDELSRSLGLMKQEALSPNEGMLFVFPKAERVAFWMKQTSLPLTAAYINGAGRIIEIHDLEPFDEHSIASASSSIAYVLEVPRDWFEKNQVLPGDLITGLPSHLTSK